MSSGTYIVWSPDLGQDEEDGAEISAYDEEAAAREWAKWHDRVSAEYDIARGLVMVVIVKNVNGKCEDFYSVSGEAVPSYSARKYVR